MDLPRLFAFHCWLILYFMNSSSTFPSDYEKEIEKLRSQVAVISNPTERETVLLQMIVQERENAHQERENAHQERENAQKLIKQEYENAQKLIKQEYENAQKLTNQISQKIGGLEAEKIEREEIIRDVACGRYFRFYMETFGLDYGVQKGDVEKYSALTKKALETIRQNVTLRRNHFNTRVHCLRELCTKYQPDSVGFLTGDDLTDWNEKVEEQYHELQNVHINKSISSVKTANTNPPELSDLVAELYFAKNESEARTIFVDQCTRCFWSTEIAEDDEKKQINKLVVQWTAKEKDAFIPPEKVEGQKGIKHEERQFLQRVLSTGQYFIVDSSQFRYCLEVFYRGDSDFIKDLAAKMKSKWGQDNFPALADRFCTNFYSLYNRVSVTDIHAPPQIPIKCTPNSTDYQRYVRKIAKTPHRVEDYLFIAETLGLIDSS